MDSKLDQGPAPPSDPDASREIEALMAEPIKGRPAVTILGDDDVAGFNPPKAKGA